MVRALELLLNYHHSCAIQEPCQLVPYSLAVYNTKSLADSSEGREMLTKQVCLSRRSFHPYVCITVLSQVAGMQERLTKAEQVSVYSSS